MKYCLGIGVLLLSNTLSAKNVYVSKEGKDNNPGSIQKPMLTVAKAIKRLKGGDTCFIAEGVYHRPINLNHLSFHGQKPLVISSMPGQKVVFDGTMPVEGKWQKVKGNTYRLKVKKPVSQLFRDDKMLLVARWPNASFEDGSFWDMKATWRHQGPASTFGTLHDQRPVAADYKKSTDEGASAFGIRKGVNMESLADTHIDFTGAIAVLNIGSWLSWAQPVVKHQAGSNVFQYSKDFSRGKKSLPDGPKFLRNQKFFNAKKKQGHYYMIGKMALDQDNEWFYDKKERAVYVVVPEGKHPKDFNYKGKVNDYLIEGVEVDNVTVKSIDFFGGTFSFNRSKNITIDDCRFDYPSYHKLVLGILDEPKVSKFDYPKKELSLDQQMKTNNAVTNCVFAYADGPGMYVMGRGDRVENCNFHDLDWTCLGSGGSGSLNFSSAEEFTFRYNTVHTGGNSEGVRVGRRSLIEYNHIYNLSLMQHDGSGINVGVAAINGSIIRFNWVHDMKKSGIRFDSSGYQTPLVNWGENGSVINNVVWSTGSIKCKGDKHIVLNNTVYNTLSGLNDIGVPRVLMMGSNNNKSIIKNNVAPYIGGHFNIKKKYPCPGDTANNWQGDVYQYLRNADNHDFRPNSTWAKRWKEPTGAYDSDPAKFWIPGYRGKLSMTPVPKNHAKNVDSNLDLFWSPARHAKTYRVYLSENKNKLGKRSVLLQESALCYAHPKAITPSKTYYWRVDVIDQKGAVQEGKVWEFGGVKSVKHPEYKSYGKPSFKYRKHLDLPKEVTKLGFSAEKITKLTKVYNTFWCQYENDKWLKETQNMLKQKGLSSYKVKKLNRFKTEVFAEASDFLLDNSTTILSSRELDMLNRSLHRNDR
ncbi:hypothetical protein K5X82_15695 [Halosquirtibacter xylanolyticus]|uniref:right-handed parallel beta-helix repeat-containing protein n=1 Tax=Halosquirtibacter xylanolyticus TaxID=3374599 RepID=UPI003747D526|nr:hypothetical protein K5X82_15695 [Prolixibacteraceae bacterium]